MLDSLLIYGITSAVIEKIIRLWFAWPKHDSRIAARFFVGGEETCFPC